MLNEAFTAEEKYKKDHIKHLLYKGGYKKYAEIFDKFEFHLTSRKNVTAYLAPNEGAIYCNRGWSDKYLSVVIRHEILHEWLDHQLRLMRKLCNEKGLDYDTLTSKSFEEVQRALYSNKLFNIAGDYEISNRGYTDADKELIRRMELNGKVFSGLITEDDHPDWIKMSIEEMYDELRKLNPEQPQDPGQGQGQSAKGHVIHGTFNDKGEFVDLDGDIIDPSILQEANHKGYDSYVFVDDTTNKSYIYKDGQFVCIDDLPNQSGPSGDGSQTDWDDDFPVDPSTDDDQSGSSTSSSQKGPKPRDDYQRDKEDQEKSGNGDGFKKADWDDTEDSGDQGSANGTSSSSDNSDDEADDGSADSQNGSASADKFRNNMDATDDAEDAELAAKEQADREANDVSGKYGAPTEHDRLKAIKEIQDKIRYQDLGNETKDVNRKERADKAAAEYRKKQAMPINRFKADLSKFINKQVGDIEEIDSWSSPKRRMAATGLPSKGKKELESYVPLINVYFDNSGSWTWYDSAAGCYPYEMGEQALEVLADLERRGKIKMRVRYFSDDSLYTKPLGAKQGGGTYATPVFDDIIATKPDNVVIMTDSDFDGTDGSRQPNIVVPGGVWFLFYGSECKSIQQKLKGKQETKKFYLSKEN